MSGLLETEVKMGVMQTRTAKILCCKLVVHEWSRLSALSGDEFHDLPIQFWASFEIQKFQSML